MGQWPHNAVVKPRMIRRRDITTETLATLAPARATEQIGPSLQGGQSLRKSKNCAWIRGDKTKKESDRGVVWGAKSKDRGVLKIIQTDVSFFEEEAEKSYHGARIRGLTGVIWVIFLDGERAKKVIRKTGVHKV